MGLAIVVVDVRLVGVRLVGVRPVAVSEGIMIIVLCRVLLPGRVAELSIALGIDTLTGEIVALGVTDSGVLLSIGAVTVVGGKSVTGVCAHESEGKGLLFTVTLGVGFIVDGGATAVKVTPGLVVII